jgi:thioredoxin reductase (NADPH)
MIRGSRCLKAVITSQSAGGHNVSGSAEHEVIIIGSGPAGYTAAIYCARAGLAPVVLEGTTLGGALMNTTEVENFPGFREGVNGPVLMDEMRGQAERFGAELVSADAVRAELRGSVKTVEDAYGTLRTARSVILAMGSEYRRLGLDDEDRFAGHGISWCATCDAAFFKGEDVLVVGGGDSAMEEALFLARFARTVTIVHRRDEFRASRIMLNRAHAEPKISFTPGAVVSALAGERRLDSVTLTDITSGEATTIAVGGLFEAVGHTPRSALVAHQVETDSDGYVVVSHPTTRTSLEGVFACGDLVDRHYRQAVTAAGTGCSAALDVERYLSAIGASRSTAALAV